VNGRPIRTTVSGRAYLDLQNLARRQRRPTDELHQIYALEGFLARLIASPYADRFVLKGGVLLAAYDNRRPSRDVDLQALRIVNDVDHVLDIVKAVSAGDAEDGLILDAANASAESIRDGDTYSGVRVTVSGSLSVANLRFHVDVNVGDPIWPAPQRIAVPRLLGGELDLIGYPLPMVHAEKLVTAVQRGVANTRWRDFADVYSLASRHDVHGAALVRAIGRVAQYRQVRLRSLSVVLNEFAEIAQPQWLAWRRKQRLEDRLPDAFASVLDRLIAFADPALTGLVANQTWSAAEHRWG
jgi:Nucleotidyl transferase AbiEii toxin, Type IV TA system